MLLSRDSFAGCALENVASAAGSVVDEDIRNMDGSVVVAKVNEKNKEEDDKDHDYQEAAGVDHTQEDNDDHNKKEDVRQMQEEPGEKWLHRRVDCSKGCVLLHMDMAVAIDHTRDGALPPRDNGHTRDAEIGRDV